jgi:hypothetical protein
MHRKTYPGAIYLGPRIIAIHSLAIPGRALSKVRWTQASDGSWLTMLVSHDDRAREYAYGPASGLSDTKVGTFTQALYDEAKTKGWNVNSMRNDWNRIFTFDK